MNDGQATRRRLLDAAREEFAAYGIAGARVDRIAANARANKSQLYAWFGSKGGLFDVVFDEHIEAVINAVPMDGEDLPGYAVGIYDESVKHPEMVRLATWARLERIPAGELVTTRREETACKRGSIAAAQRNGHVDPSLDPQDVQAMVAALALTWSAASLYFTATSDDPKRDHERRRRALDATVRRAFAPRPPA